MLLVLCITLVIIIGTIVPVIFLHRTSNNQSIEPYVYPNILFFNGTYSDMVVENDSSIHFVIASHNLTIYHDNAAIYVHLNLNKTSFDSSIIGGGLVSYYQVEIGLTPLKKPISYIYFMNSFFDLVSTVNILQEGIWETYPSFRDLPQYLSIYTMGPVFDWSFTTEGELLIAYIYVNEDATPAIYNESFNEWIFLNNTFPEIVGRETNSPGDFIVKNQSLALLWTRHRDEYHNQPYVATYNPEEGWKLFKLGTETEDFLPKAIISEKDAISVFFYDPGRTNQNSRLFRTKIYNSSYYTTEEIASFDGRVRFYGDSIKALNDNSYIFVYTKKSFDPLGQYDLYLGQYENSTFKETQLTNTLEYDEYLAHCEIGTSYLHYTWMRTTWNENEKVNPFKCVVFYNRSLITEIKKQPFETNKQQKSILVNEYENNVTNTIEHKYLLESYVNLPKYNRSYTKNNYPELRK